MAERMGRMNEKVVHTERHWRCRLDTAQDKSAETAATDTSYSTHAGSPSFDDNAAATAIAVFLFRPLSPVSVCLWEWAATADRRRRRRRNRSDDTIADRPAANRQLKKKKTQLWQKQQSKKGIEQQLRRAQLATTVC